MGENTQVRQLYRDALSGKLNRREVFQRGIALGLSANVIGMLALNAVKVPSAFAAEEGKPTATFYDWMLNLHPRITSLGEEQGVDIQTAPTENFGNDRFIAEGLQKNSTWDFYGGVTPFLEMIGLVDSGTIEPWTQYVPADLTSDFVPATLTEGTYKGQFYVWPLLLDICVQMRHADLVQKAGLDPEASPATWDEFIANGQKVMDSKAAPYGIVFDHRDWRSLIPVTHSISIDVYDKDTGLFQYASDPALEALEILKRMMPLAPADLLTADAVDNTVHPDRGRLRCRAGRRTTSSTRTRASSSRPTGRIRPSCASAVCRRPRTVSAVPSSGTPARCCSPTARTSRRLSSSSPPSPRTSGSGRTASRAIRISVRSRSASCLFCSRSGPRGMPRRRTGTRPIRGPSRSTTSLQNASAIAPTILGIKQFDTARPEWHKYLSGEEPDAKIAGTEGAWTPPCAECEKQRDADGRTAQPLLLVRSNVSPAGSCRPGPLPDQQAARSLAYRLRWYLSHAAGVGPWHRRPVPCDSVPVTGSKSHCVPVAVALDFLRTYPYLLPAIIFFLGWQLLPIYDALRISFTDDQVSSIRSRPTGSVCDNYRDVLHDPRLLEGVKPRLHLHLYLRARHDLHSDGRGSLPRPGQEQQALDGLSCRSCSFPR